MEYLNNKGLGGVDVLRKLTATPDRLAKNIELFEWAQKEGYEIHRLNAELTKDFFKEKGYTKTIENRYRNAFANFFGTSTGQQYGFAYDFEQFQGPDSNGIIKPAHISTPSIFELKKSK